uniref:N-acetylglucosamine-6-phosphate deacetylase n=1 Tax=Lygus hesperus TaxID=30085 RepID=A0A0A9YEJ9_LYGHE
MSEDLDDVMRSWDQFSWDLVRPDVVYAFVSDKVLRQDRLTEGRVYVQNGVIIPTPDENVQVVTIDLGKDTILAPGFIDLQINGGFGIDFTSSLGEDSSGLQEIASKLLQYGVTSFCPTIVSSTPDNYEKILKNIRVFNGSKEGAGCLGAHLEGPFISLSHNGAHDPKCIFDYPKGIQDIDRMYGKNLKNVAIVTLAPEKENSMSIIKYLTEKNIVVSIGHTDASFEEASGAIENGARMVTHLFNSMTSFHHRIPGVIGLLGHVRHAEEPLYFGLVADNNHIHTTTLRIAHNAQPSATVLVSDGIAALGLGDGKHSLGSQIIKISGTRAVIDGTDTLSGSVTAIDQCVRNFLDVTGCSHAQALAAASYRPAQVLQISASKGNITHGADADFVVLDNELNVLSTWIQGRLVHRAQIV